MAVDYTSIPPADLAPLELTRVVFTNVNADNTLGEAFSPYDRLAVSYESNSTRETETIPTGKGADIDRTTSEKHTGTLTTSGFYPAMHAMLTGKETETVTAPVRVFVDAVPTAGVYTFPTDAAPVVYSGTDYGLIVTDYAGNNLTPSTGSTAEAGTYVFDSSEKTITVATTVKELTISYYKSVSTFHTSAPDTVLTPTFMLQVISLMQSIERGGERWYREQRVSRAMLAGDVDEATASKEVGDSVEYSIEASSPAAGEKAYDEFYYKA